MIHTKRKLTKKQIEKAGWNSKPIDLDKARLLRSQGMTWKKVAKIFSVSVMTVRRQLNPELAAAHSKEQMDRQVRNKYTLIEYKNGECCICGYNRTYWALDFHHVYQEDKSFSISRSRGRNIDVLKKEADKTIMVCRNCHAEVHAGLHPEHAEEFKDHYVRPEPSEEEPEDYMKDRCLRETKVIALTTCDGEELPELIDPSGQLYLFEHL
jgi:hypothetical protein